MAWLNYASSFIQLQPIVITEEMVLAAQAAWGQAIVEIGQLRNDRPACERFTEAQIKALYALEASILFKPTKAAQMPFRSDLTGTLSYFIGGNPAFPEDQGFALQPWTNVRFEPAGLHCQATYALAMGHYYFTDLQGAETKVEYTFGYIKMPDGTLKIALHHSSLPYQPV